MASITSKLRKAYNTFSSPPEQQKEDFAGTFGSAAFGASSRPDRVRTTVGMAADRTIITSIYTRIGIDLASIQMRHVKLDDKDRFMSDVESGLNNCLTVEANIDQAARDFRQDIAMSLCSDGYLAIVPVDTSTDPNTSTSFDIYTLRVGRIVAWHPDKVRVSLYNDKTGLRQEVLVKKSYVAIVTNPLYAIMNEPNSTLQRLVRKLGLLDAIDEQSASGKLDLIIQLPYVIKSESRKLQAEQRRADIEQQLKGSKYGIAYTDGTEKITQLNRPSENNLMGQIDYLTKMLYGQLGITEEVMNGTANEATMLNYWNRTIEPMVSAISEAMHRTFLTKTARTQKQAIRYFRDPFRLVPIANIAEIADKFTRNEVMSSNEIRQVVGMSPSGDPKADQLINSNMPQADTGLPVAGPQVVEGEVVDEAVDDGSDAAMNESLDSITAKIDAMTSELGGDESG